MSDRWSSINVLYIGEGSAAIGDALNAMDTRINTARASVTCIKNQIQGGGGGEFDCVVVGFLNTDVDHDLISGLRGWGLPIIVYGSLSGRDIAGLFAAGVDDYVDVSTDPGLQVLVKKIASLVEKNPGFKPLTRRDLAQI
jgi:hypothetical protein